MKMFHLYDNGRIVADGVVYPDRTVALKQRKDTAIIEVFESHSDAIDKHTNRHFVDCLPVWALNGKCDCVG